MNSQATSALNFPISFCLNKNCLFKLDNSIVSKSTTCMFFTPDKAKFFRISQPKPPAPTTNILRFGNASFISSHGEKFSPGYFDSLNNK